MEGLRVKPLWAIQLQPFAPRSKPWIDYRTVRRTRKEAWATFREGAAEQWLKTIDKRKRSGHIRCVKVAVAVCQ